MISAFRSHFFRKFLLKLVNVCERCEADHEVRMTVYIISYIGPHTLNYITNIKCASLSTIYIYMHVTACISGCLRYSSNRFTYVYRLGSSLPPCPPRAIAGDITRWITSGVHQPGAVRSNIHLAQQSEQSEQLRAAKADRK